MIACFGDRSYGALQICWLQDLWGTVIESQAVGAKGALGSGFVACQEHLQGTATVIGNTGTSCEQGMLTDKYERGTSHTHAYTHTDTHTRMHTCICTCAYAHVYTCVCIHTHMCSYIQTYTDVHTHHTATSTGACVYPVEWSMISCFRVFLLSVCSFQVYTFLPVFSAIAGPRRLPVCKVTSDTSSKKNTFIQLIIYSAWTLNWVFTKNIK